MQLGDSNANCCLPSSLSSLAKREPLVVVDVVVQKYPLFFLLRSYLIFFYWWEWSKIALLFLTRGLLTRREKKGGGYQINQIAVIEKIKMLTAYYILHTAAHMFLFLFLGLLLLTHWLAHWWGSWQRCFWNYWWIGYGCMISVWENSCTITKCAPFLCTINQCICYYFSEVVEARKEELVSLRGGVFFG